jgi:hypothetical protein
MDREDIPILKKIALIILIGILSAIIGRMLSYVIGMAYGSIGTNLSGAAAASYGLAKLGGGAISKGGKGVRGGKMLITFAFGIAGVVIATVFFFVRFVLSILKQRGFI